MLSRIEIKNFAIIQTLDLNWSNGMSVITGETGAGKSIVIDALGLSLGERAEQSVIYPNAKQAEVTSVFELDQSSQAIAWLQEQELDEDNECILRRVIIRQGRSKCFINGRSATQSQLKQLGSLLVDIHGQHENQSLLKPKEQLNLLDRYAGHDQLLEKVKQAALTIQTIQKRKTVLEKEQQTRQAKQDLLTYQVDELTQANPEQAILNTLAKEHKQAATSQDRLALIEESLSYLSDDETNSCLTQLGQIIDKVSQLKNIDESSTNCYDILIQIENLLQEAQTEMSHYRDQLNCDPEKLQQLDDQLSLFHDLARKHHVELEALPHHFTKLQQELSQLVADESELVEIEQSYQQAIKDYAIVAKKLSDSRKKVAKKLDKLITGKIQSLAMQGGELKIEIEALDDDYRTHGMDKISFLVSANPGQPLQALNKVASGGELSRISLAIATITAEQQLAPSIIFDEVDVGIGGATAEVVGQLLNELAKKRQVLCVTHQPQVAACGNHHLVASKTKQVNQTTTQVIELNQKQRVEEIGRMLGGIKISDKTLSHAKEMLGI